VSFGDVVSGPNSWMNVLGGALETMATSLGKELASHAKEIENKDAKADKGPNAQLAGEIYKNAIVDAGEQIVSQFNRAEKEEGFRAIVFYLAAVADDPSNKPAWFRLAYFSKGERRARAIAESIRLDPDNAFPYYLQAVAAFEQGDLVATRNSVQTASQRRVCTAYESPLPKQVQFRYPDHEWLRELGVVGRPIPYSAFAYFVHFQTSAFTQIRFLSRNDLIHRFRDIAQRFSDEAERLLKLGKTREAVTWLEARHEMGLQLMRFEPRDSIMCLSGMAFASDCDALKRVYLTLDDNDKLRRTEANQARLKRWIDEYRAIQWPPGRKKDDENAIMREAAQGTRDFLQEDRRILENTLQHAGLIEAPHRKEK
jgi:hypothetical protein